MDWNHHRRLPRNANSEHLLRLFVDAVKDYAIVMMDPTGEIMTWNTGAELLNGYRADEIIGQHFSRFYGEEDRRHGLPQKLLAQATQDGRAEAEGWWVRKDGSCFWANVVITPLYDEDGELIGFGKVTRDLSERRRAEESFRAANDELKQRADNERLFRLLVEAVKDYAIYFMDPAGNIRTWNTGAELLKGYRADEIIGRNFSCFYTPADLQAGMPQKLLAQAQQHGRTEAEGWRVRKDGSRFWADVVITPLYKDGTLIGFTKVTRDLSERRRAQEALRKANEELERRVLERTTDLQQRLTELEQFHDVVVDRELKMIKLEKEIAALKQESTSLKP